MAKHFVGFGSTSNIIRVKLLDSGSTTGAGKQGITSGSAGLSISLTADNEVTPITYTGGNIAAIVAVGSYVAPAANKCNVKLVSDSVHPGVLEIHFLDTRWAVANSKRMTLSIQATGVVEYDAEIELGLPPLSIAAASYAPDGTASVGSATGLSLQAGQSYGTDVLKNRSILITSGTGAGQTAVIKGNTSASPSVLTFHQTLAVALDATSQYVIGGVADIFRAVQIELTGAYTAQQILSVALAVLAGTHPDQSTFKTPDGAVTRAVGTTTVAGIRSAITLTPSS